MTKVHTVMSPAFLIVMIETAHELHPDSNVRIAESGHESGGWFLFVDAEPIAIVPENVLDQATKIDRLYLDAAEWRLRPIRNQPTNCQHEPPYLGDSTVVFSMRAPGLTAHRATTLCSIEEPHAIAECREWNAGEETNNATETR